jgi:hypothetical protein
MLRIISSTLGFVAGTLHILRVSNALVTFRIAFDWLCATSAQQIFPYHADDARA